MSISQPTAEQIARFKKHCDKWNKRMDKYKEPHVHWAIEYLDEGQSEHVLSQEQEKHILEALHEEYPPLLNDEDCSEWLKDQGHKARGKEKFLQYGRDLGYELMDYMENVSPETYGNIHFCVV